MFRTFKQKSQIFLILFLTIEVKNKLFNVIYLMKSFLNEIIT